MRHGQSAMAMWTSAPSLIKTGIRTRSDLASGNGLAAFTRSIAINVSEASHGTSKRREPPSMPLGTCFCRSAPKPSSRPRAARNSGLPTNTRYGMPAILSKSGAARSTAVRRDIQPTISRTDHGPYQPHHRASTGHVTDRNAVCAILSDCGC